MERRYIGLCGVRKGVRRVIHGFFAHFPIALTLVLLAWLVASRRPGHGAAWFTAVLVGTTTAYLSGLWAYDHSLFSAPAYALLRWHLLLATGSLLLAFWAWRVRKSLRPPQRWIPLAALGVTLLLVGSTGSEMVYRQGTGVRLAATRLDGPLPPVSRGLVLFRQRCSTCHGAPGAGLMARPLGTISVRRAGGIASLVTFLHATMPPGARPPLTWTEARALAHYLATLP